MPELPGLFLADFKVHLFQLLVIPPLLRALKTVATAPGCLKPGSEFLQLSDLQRDQPERGTASYTRPKKQGKDLKIVHGVSIFPRQDLPDHS